MMTRPLRALLPALLLAAAVAHAGPAPADAPAIRWRGYEEGVAEAGRTGRLLLLNFTADWCKFCKKMKAETYTDPQVVAAVNAGFVPVMVDTDKDQRRAQEFFVRGLPTIWFVEKDGTSRITALPGYVDAPTFLQILKYLSTRSFETMDFKTFVEKGA